MMADTFEQIIRRYHLDGVVFSSPKRGSNAYYSISSVDATGFTVDRLSASEPVRCTYELLDKKLQLVRDNGGHVPFLEFDNTTAVQMAYLQASELGVSLDRKEIVDLADESSALNHFKQLLTSLNVNKSGQVIRLYKPITVWCVLDAVRSGDLKPNQISFEWLVPRFLKKANELGIEVNQQHAAEAFFHLTGDLFWLLAYHDPKQYLYETPSSTLIRERVQHASIKETYWRLLSAPDVLQSLLDLIETHWFSQETSKANSMNFNLHVLDLAVEKTIRPFLIEQGKLKDPKEEGYLQATVFPKVNPVLQKETIEADSVGSLQKALDANINLLSRFEKQWAVDFLKTADADEVRGHVVELLYGSGSLEDRIREFSEWSKPSDTGGGKKSGIHLTVIGYLLGLSNPVKYAFCKPSVYAAAVAALLPNSVHQLDGVERLAYATDFYRAALKLFTTRYGLPFTNLLDVHTAFYIMKNTYHGLPGWDELEGSTPPVKSDDLNLILYGPPGTGKTYNTSRIAVEICDGHAPLDHKATMTRYQQLRDENRVGFITFHQSYGYEDFVEGIRPVLDSGERSEAAPESADRTTPSEVRYECRDGIFKKMCAWAGRKSIKRADHAEVDLDKATVWKMSLGDTQIPDEAAIYDECIKNNYVLLGYGKGLNFEDCKSRDEIIAKLKAHDPGVKPTDYDVTSINAFQQQMAVGDLIVISDGNLKFRAIARVSGPYRFLDRPSYWQMRPVEWLAVFDESLPRETINDKAKFSQMTLYRLRKQDLKLVALKDLFASKPEGPRNHVLIIDEINRGNISKILGELITLLEPDKRLGAENELIVTLPYSSDKFGVPANLYVVGTMNTADRSIAFLDVALRRRFRFIEMMPKPEIIRSLSESGGDVDGIDVPQLLETINDRIELLYDRDHQIGHSFFLNVTSLVQLREAFCGKVIPLLQEYFYGDWTKVCFVLGCPFDDSGKTANQNSHPIIQTRLLSAGNPTGVGMEGIEDKVRCDVHPKFASASATSDLQPFFEGVVASAKGP